jgi:hypothetical protein
MGSVVSVDCLLRLACCGPGAMAQPLWARRIFSSAELICDRLLNIQDVSFD